MESKLTFNQLICEFESRRPRQNIYDFSLQISVMTSPDTMPIWNLKS